MTPYQHNEGTASEQPKTATRVSIAIFGGNANGNYMERTPPATLAQMEVTSSGTILDEFRQRISRRGRHDRIRFIVLLVFDNFDDCVSIERHDRRRHTD